MQPISPLVNLIYRKLRTRMPFISSYDEETITNIISKLFQPLGNEFCEVLYRDKTFSIENMFCYDTLVFSKNMSREYIESYSKLHLKYRPIENFNTYDYIVIKNNDISYCFEENIYMTIPKGESFYFALQNMLIFNYLPHNYPKMLIDPKIERWAFKFIEKWDATEELALYPLNMTKIYITLG